MLRCLYTAALAQKGVSIDFFLSNFVHSLNEQLQQGHQQTFLFQVLV